jgi:hypothetical protein
MMIMMMIMTSVPVVRSFVGRNSPLKFLYSRAGMRYTHFNGLMVPVRATQILPMMMQQDAAYTTNTINTDIERLRGKKITNYWLSELAKLDRPSARMLIPQLNADTPLGFEPATGPVKKGTFLEYTIQQKIEHEDKVILIRNGEFYETFGVDALMLINYCGLNAMGGKAKAGCPSKNVQQTLDGLTAAGLSVAVYEEVSEIELAKKSQPSKAPRIKHRMLTQIVSPAFTTYAYDLCLRSEAIDYKENKPILAIMSTASGYAVYEVWLDEKRISVSDRLTLEAVRTIVEQYGHVEPAYIYDSNANIRSSSQSKRASVSLNSLPFLSSVENIECADERSCIDQVLRRISRRFEVNTSEFRWQQTLSSSDRPRSIYTSTALQIGLFENPNVPDLVPHLLPSIHYAHSAKFLKKWLLHPPDKRLADHMRQLCLELSQLSVSLPPFAPIPVGKLVSLIHARQANIGMLREIRQSVVSMLIMLRDQTATDAEKKENKANKKNPYESVVQNLFELTAAEVGGIKFSHPQIIDSCERIIQLIDSVVHADPASSTAASDAITTDPSGRIPNDFFARNEDEFKNKLVTSIPEVQELYSHVHTAAVRLMAAVESDFPADAEIVFDVLDNAIMCRDPKTKLIAASSSSTTDESSKNKEQNVPFIPYIDRKGAVVSKRYTTQAVKDALLSYQRIVESAPAVITGIVQVRRCNRIVHHFMWLKSGIWYRFDVVDRIYVRSWCQS